MPKSTGDEWLGTPAAARFLGVGLRTVYAFIDRGELPAYQLGRVIRVRRVDLLTFLDTHRVQPGSIGHLYEQGEDARVCDDENG